MAKAVNVLLVYDMLPEEVQFYKIPNPTPEQLKLLETVHGHFLGEDLTEEVGMAADQLNLLICPGYDDIPKGEWADYKLTIQERQGIYADVIYYTGAFE